MALRKGKNLPQLHELESVVMGEVWRLGRTTVREVMEAVNHRAPRERAYTTYMTIMGRLHNKGLLKRRREGKTDAYWPAVSKDDYLEARARTEVAAVVKDYGDVALAHFVRQVESLDPERRRKLRRIARGKQ